MSILEQLKEIVAETMPDIDPECITPSARLKEDLGMESLELMMTAITVEERFGIQFESSMKFDTVAELCSYIESRAEA